MLTQHDCSFVICLMLVLCHLGNVTGRIPEKMFSGRFWMFFFNEWMLKCSDVFIICSCPCDFLQNKTCVQTLEGHAQNVSCVSFHPELPIIITGSEDGNWIFSGIWRKGEELVGNFFFVVLLHVSCPWIERRDKVHVFLFSLGTVRIWHSSTYRLESTLNYGMERVWCVASLRGSNNVALGYDEGSIIVKVPLIIWDE